MGAASSSSGSGTGGPPPPPPPPPKTKVVKQKSVKETGDAAYKKAIIKGTEAESLESLLRRSGVCLGSRLTTASA